VAKRKTLFDDRPIEISELTYVIRQDIASLNTQIASLQSYIRAQKQPQVAAGKGQVEEHNSNVVMMLQSRLADMGMGFKDVLELRTQVSEISRLSCGEGSGESLGLRRCMKECRGYRGIGGILREGCRLLGRKLTSRT
jgi:hypothetical protein